MRRLSVSCRHKKMDYAALSAAHRHGHGMDERSRGRRRDDAAARCLAWSKASGDEWQVCGVDEDAPALDLKEAFRLHKEQTGAVQRAGRAVASHYLLVVSPETMEGQGHDPYSERVRTLAKVGKEWAEATFGAENVLAVRVDVDEEGCGVVDAFVAPTEVQRYGRSKREKLTLSPNAGTRRLAEARGFENPTYRRQGIVLQDSWHEYARDHFDARLQRGDPKAKTKRTHLSPEEFGAAADAMHQSLQQQQSDLDAWATEMRSEAEADREAALRDREAAVDDRRRAAEERAAADAWARRVRADAEADRQAARAERIAADQRQAALSKGAAALALREQQVAKREALADARHKKEVARRAELAALDARLAELQAKAQRLVDAVDVLRAEWDEYDGACRAKRVASDLARADADLLPSEDEMLRAAGVDLADGTSLRWRDAAGSLMKAILQTHPDGSKDSFATIRPRPDDPLKALRMFPLGDVVADSVQYARRGAAGAELGAGLVDVFKALMRAARLPRVVAVEQERDLDGWELHPR